MQSKTKSGVAVTVIPKGHTYCGSATPEVWLDFVHPVHGRCLVVAKHFGRSADGTAEGAIGYGYAGVTGEFQTKSFRSKTNLQNTCITVPRADFDAAMDVARAEAAVALAAEKAEDARRAADARAACPVGSVACRQKWANGDLMSACYVTEDGVEVLDSDLLENHGGWYWLPLARVEEARSAAAEKAAKKEADLAARASKTADALAMARMTGKPREIARWTEDCDGSEDECSTDLCVRYAMPDGTQRVERTHTY